jgi:hypothetical protein
MEAGIVRRLSKAHNLFGETLGWWEFGMGREWGGDEEGEVSLRGSWGQGGQDRITPKEGFQVSEREWKRELIRNWQGEQKEGYCA